MAGFGVVIETYHVSPFRNPLHATTPLNAEKIERSRAVITRRLTPGQWTYSIDILEQDSLLKQLKKQFHQNHEPSGGRELTWMMKLLLNLA
jgi:hypothetical protein